MGKLNVPEILAEINRRVERLRDGRQPLPLDSRRRIAELENLRTWIEVVDKHP